MLLSAWGSVMTQEMKEKVGLPVRNVQLMFLYPTKATAICMLFVIVTCSYYAWPL